MEILHKYKDTFPQIMEQPLPDNRFASVSFLYTGLVMLG
jgi:hypothetical protein